MQGLMQGIANPLIADIGGAYDAGVEKRKGREFDETLSAVVSNSPGYKFADLLKIDPKKAVQYSEAMGIPKNETDRLKNAMGIVAMSSKLLSSGTVEPQAVGQFLLEQAQMLGSQGLGTELLQKSGQAFISGDPEAIEAEREAFARLASEFGGDETKYSAKTQILEDGSSIQMTNSGKRIVKDPSGKVVTGSEAAKVIKAANEEGIRLQSERAGGRASAVGEENAATDLINRGIAAAESTSTVRRALTLLDQVETGGWESISLTARQRLGLADADESELSASLGKSVLSQLRETFGSAFTENEGLRLERIEANIGNSTAGNKRLLKQALRIAERTAKRARKKALDRGQDDVVADIDELLAFSLDFNEEEKQEPKSSTPKGQIKLLGIE